MTCRYCTAWAATKRPCAARSHGECDCPRCQGLCDCRAHGTVVRKDGARHYACACGSLVHEDDVLWATDEGRLNTDIGKPYCPLCVPDPPKVECPKCGREVEYLQEFYDRHGIYSGRACSDRCGASLPGQGDTWNYDDTDETIEPEPEVG